VKSYVLDASALLVFLQKKPSARKVAEIFKEALRGRAGVLMSAVNVGEVYAVIVREHGIDRAASTMSALSPLPVQFIDVTPRISFRAAEVKARYKLHYLDSFAASLAIDNKATLATCDSDFRSLANILPILWLKS
jgi:predicted nucleic acid-binding protein